MPERDGKLPPATFFILNFTEHNDTKKPSKITGWVEAPKKSPIRSVRVTITIII